MTKKIKIPGTTICDYRTHEGANVRFKVPAWILRIKNKHVQNQLTETFERSVGCDETHPENDDDCHMLPFNGDMLEESVYIGEIENVLNIPGARAKKMVQRAWKDGRSARFRFERAIRKMVF